MRMSRNGSFEEMCGPQRLLVTKSATDNLNA